MTDAPGPAGVHAHPLLASEVIRLSGTDPAPDETQLQVTCAVCGRDQSLAESPVEAAADPQDITAYRCVDGCAVLVTTGHPNPMPIPHSGRYRFGDYALATQLPTGLLITLPSGRRIRLVDTARGPAG